jgi:hypothetical protein
MSQDFSLSGNDSEEIKKHSFIANFIENPSKYITLFLIGAHISSLVFFTFLYKIYGIYGDGYSFFATNGQKIEYIWMLIAAFSGVVYAIISKKYIYFLGKYLVTFFSIYLFTVAFFRSWYSCDWLICGLQLLYYPLLLVPGITISSVIFYVAPVLIRKFFIKSHKE